MNLLVHMGWFGEKYPVIAKFFLRQILEALNCCIGLGILHRDLKPENILVNTLANPHTVKLSDFGSARAFINPEAILTPEVVTMGYRAPEILLGSPQYSYPVDIWSVGCIFYEMVQVKHKKLFPAESDTSELFKTFRLMGTPDENSWPGVSQLPDYKPDFPKYAPKDLATLVPNLEREGVDLLSKMLSLDPSKRITAQDALEHDYLR